MAEGGGAGSERSPDAMPRGVVVVCATQLRRLLALREGGSCGPDSEFVGVVGNNVGVRRRNEQTSSF